MADFSTVPSTVKLNLKPFKAHVDEQKLKDFKELLRLSPIGPAVFENSFEPNGRRYGTRREWLIEAKQHWLEKFDWRKSEDHINSFPNFTAEVDNNVGGKIELHFVALFSQKKDAIPIAFYHGWPGSFLEFVQILDILKKRYTPQDLPYHVIVPSLPGYGYSASPPLDKDYTISDGAEALNNLMVGLGFESGYIAQGGDLGSFISRYQAAQCDACAGMHLNFSPMGPPKNADTLVVEEIEARGFARAKAFVDTGSAYSKEHGTRTATIGLALAASPVALLSWIGEKFLEWSDEDPSLDAILESVTLYWFTDSFPRGIWPYRDLAGNTNEKPRIQSMSPGAGGRPDEHVDKPSGYSFFPLELLPVPKSWVGTSANLVSASTHTSGGHFAAMEKPNELLADVEEYIKKAWKVPGGKL